MLKKLSNKLEPFYDVLRIYKEIVLSKRGKDIRILEHLLLYANIQLGNRQTGPDYCVREDGERISNWEVNIGIFYDLNRQIADIYPRDSSLSIIIRDNLQFPYLERAICILNSWLVHLNLDASNRIGKVTQLTNIMRDRLWFELYRTEHDMAGVTMNRNQYDLTEGHYQRSLTYSRRYGVEGEQKTSAIFSALCGIIELRNRQCNYSSSVSFAEEAYNLVVVAYDPVHIQVQEAAAKLITCLTRKGDLFNAERFAEITYSNLKDHKNGIDQESEDVAMGAYNFAEVLYKQNSELIKAEELARKALGIRVRLGDHALNRVVGASCSLLANILLAQNRLGDETKELYERSLVVQVLTEGPDGHGVVLGNSDLGKFYLMLSDMQSSKDMKRTQLLLTHSYYSEACRIARMIKGHSHPDTVLFASVVSDISTILSKIR
jgi:hypothetical protein